jgi:hypothetical protein
MRIEEPEKNVPIINGGATEIMHIGVVLYLEERA